MKTKYTVLLLRPDYQWDGAAGDWVLREHVSAYDPLHAVSVAQRQVLVADYGQGIDSVDDLAPLAVYEEHLMDLYPA